MANDRITQAAVEVLVQPDNQKARVSQSAVEVLVGPDNQKARVSQAAVEVLVGPARKIQILQAKKVVSGGNSFDLTFDQAATAGSQLVLVLFTRGSAAQTTPTGYTLSPAGTTTLPSDNNREIGIYYKPAAGGETSIASIQTSGGGLGVFMEIAGVKATPTSSANIAEATNGTFEGGGALSIGSATEVIVVGGDASASFGSNLVTPTNPTVELSDDTVTGGEKPSSWAAYKLVYGASGSQKIQGTASSVSHTGSSILFEADTAEVHSGSGTMALAATAQASGTKNAAASGTAALSAAAQESGAKAAAGAGTISLTAQLVGDGNSNDVSGSGSMALAPAMTASGTKAVAGTGTISLTAALAANHSGLADPFDRVVALGLDWGFGPLGQWGNGPATSTFEVDGDLAIIHQNGTSLYGYQEVDGLPDELLQADIWEEHVTFVWPNAIEAGTTVLVDMAIEEDAYNAAVGGTVKWVDGSTELSILAWWYSATDADDSGYVVLGSTEPGADEVAHLKFRYTPSTGVVEARYWRDSDPEPTSWDATVAGGPSAGDFPLAGGTHTYLLGSSSPGNAGQVWRFDSLEVTPVDIPFNLSQRPFALDGGFSTSTRPFSLLADGASSRSRRPFSLLGIPRSTSTRPFALEGPVGSYSFRPFALDANAPPTQWGGYVGGAPRYGVAVLAVDAPAGSTTVYVVDATGLRAGQAVILNDPEGNVIAAISGTAVTLGSPTAFAHPAGSQLRYALPAPALTAPTVLAAPASEGDTSVTVADPTGITPGSSLIVGGEVVAVVSVAGAVVGLAAPLGRSYAAGTSVQPPGPFRPALPVYDKGGHLLGSLVDATVTSPPSWQINGMGQAEFYVYARASSEALLYDDRIVGMQTQAGEEPWAGTITVQDWGDGRKSAQCDDAFALLAGGRKIELKDPLADGTSAAQLLGTAISMHNATAAEFGEVQWQVDASGSSVFRGNLDYEGDAWGLIQHIVARSGIEVSWRAELGSTFVPTLLGRDKFEASGAALKDGPDPDANVRSVDVTRDPTPIVHELTVTGEPFNTADCLPEWASWAAQTITPTATATVDPGVHRFRAAEPMSVDWGFTQAEKDAMCNARLDDLYSMFFDYLKAVHDIEGRPFHEGYLWEGLNEYLESRESGAQSMSIRRWRTRLQLVETFADTPASAIYISDARTEEPLFLWFIVTYNRATGAQGGGYWAFPLVEGAGMTRWHLANGQSYTVYLASGGRIYRTFTGTVSGGGSGTGGFLESYNTRLWDPFAKRYRDLRRILGGGAALTADDLIGFMDPAQPGLVMTDLGPGAGIDMSTLSSLIGKVYDFELLNIDKWDPRRDGVGAYLSQPSIFDGSPTTRPRWHIVSWGGVEGATTTIISGITETETQVEVGTNLGFPRDTPFTVAIDDGPRTEIVTVNAIAGSLWTVARGQSGTDAIIHEAGAPVALVDTGQGFVTLPEIDPTWAAGQEFADALLARLSKARTLLNLRVAMPRTSPRDLERGSLCTIQITTEGNASGFTGTARVIGASPDPQSGETELVVEYPYPLT